jgi:diphosphomevalonate decarboxylase
MNDSSNPIQASFTATAPSNIAFIKYWGKRNPELQWPANDSLSMTLDHCKTITTARRTDLPYDSFTFNEQTMTSQEHPHHKIFNHISLIRRTYGLNGSLLISSENTFPTGCGIASSASGFAALTLATAAALTGQHTWDHLNAFGITRSNVANLARMGSGSAGRSLFGGYVMWAAGGSPTEQSVSQLYQADHWDLADIIVVLSDDEKKVSSSEAHLAAWGSPLFHIRLAGLSQRFQILNEALKGRDLEKLGAVIEDDALEMHAVAMTGTPPVCYLNTDTQNLLAWVRHERSAGRFNGWFTVDAGPNVHVICRSQDSKDLSNHIKKNWTSAKIIIDHVGQGPTVSQNSNAHVRGGATSV